ncbi:hypothetical protein F5890DRAFT_1048866 [Lentinula detonsa]|uniref:Uncharacterized protein n=1 Tax=Lentinula detonsa TaxID=2804962 RepID=A0AA38Q982_9AGAR|nr:hypothetical protein F5890DRAFT_1048866 [Lentinula detonsa]
MGHLLALLHALIGPLRQMKARKLLSKPLELVIFLLVLPIRNTLFPTLTLFHKINILPDVVGHPILTVQTWIELMECIFVGITIQTFRSSLRSLFEQQRWYLSLYVYCRQRNLSSSYSSNDAHCYLEVIGIRNFSKNYRPNALSERQL